MIKRVAVGLVVLLLVTGTGLFFWARSVLTNDTVRATLVAQLSKSLGQPVSVQGLSATIYPRLTVKLTGVSIGAASEITMDALDVGTGVRALLSRRIEAATLRIDGAHLSLPLPPIAFGHSEGSTPAEGSGQPPVQLGSVDAVVLTNIQIVSRGRTLRGDIDVVPHGTSALTIRKMALVADGARIDATGEITNLAGPVGTLSVKAGALDLDELLAFASDFSAGNPASGRGPAGGTPTPTAPIGSPAVDLTVTLAAERATMGGISVEAVSGRARLQGQAVSVDPLRFTLFGGSYEGTLGATLTGEPTFSWTAALTNLDVAALTTFAGNPGVLTGRLAAQVDLRGSGMDAARAMKTARGTARVTITNGIVKDLALVRSVVAATSLNPQAVVASSLGALDEPFSEMGATLAIAGGTASTQNLRFVSKDIRLDAAGALKLDGSAVNLKGAVRMSEELSKQANGAVTRFTEQDGRITLPATVTGAAGQYAIEIDAAAMAKRAIANEAKTGAQDAVKKGLGRLFGR